MSDSELTGRLMEEERALRTAEEAFGACSFEVVTALIRLGGALRSAGRLAEAHGAWVRALEKSEETLGSDHIQLARIFRCLAELELSRGRFVAGESYARRSLEICETAADAAEGEVADSRQVLAALLAGQDG